MKRNFFAAFVAVFLMAALSGYGQHINGTIFEPTAGEPKPLPGVNIYWKGTQSGTVSDENGHFQINVSRQTHDLVFSFVGYENDTLHVHHGEGPVIHVMRQSLNLDEVEVVTTARTAFVSRLSTINATTITSGELTRAACCNLSESFETSASVDVSYTDAVTGAKQIELLGLAGIYTQMMSENVPNLRGLATTFGLTYIPGSWMESIQVSKGASSVLNGYESISGQINVEYKKPRLSERFFLNLYQSHAGRSEANFNASLHLTEKLSTMLLGHVSSQWASHDKNGDGFLSEPLFTQYNFFNRWDYDQQNFEFQFGIKALKEDRMGGQVAFDPELPRNLDNGYGIQINTERYEAFLKTGFIFNRPATSLGIQNQVIYHDLESFFGLKDFDARQFSYYGNLLFQSYINNTQHTYTTGVSMVYDRIESRGNVQSGMLEERVPGVFFQYTYSDGHHLNLIAGIRADHHNVHGLFYTPRLHARYNFNEQTILRISAGKGYRSANVIAENLSLMASSRPLVFDFGATDKQKMEEAWNFGINLSRFINIANRELTLNIDLYRTEFLNQVVVDRFTNNSEIRVYNLDGKSYSNSMQVEANYELFPKLDVTAAFRLNDVKMTYESGLEEKPFVNKYKGLLSFSYKPGLGRWQYDLTGQFNGQTRLPSTVQGPENLDTETRSPAYTIVNAQVTRNFRKWNLYLGGENLTNFVQKDPIIAPHDPFGEQFDASMIWGPIMGMKIYAGLRYTID